MKLTSYHPLGWLLTLAFSFIFCTLPAQTQQFYKFQAEMGDHSLLETPNGDFMAAGTIYTNDPANPTDIQVVYFDPTGAVMWSNRYDFGAEERCFHVAQGALPNEFVLTGYRLDASGIRRAFLLILDQTGAVLMETDYLSQYGNTTLGCTGALEHAHGMHVIFNEEFGNPGYTVAGFSSQTIPLSNTTDKKILVFRVDMGGNLLWDLQLTTPNGPTAEDWDMGEFIMEIPNYDAYYITGSSNEVDPMGNTNQATLSLRVDFGGAIAWHASYQPVNSTSRNPGASAVFINFPTPLIVNLSNSTQNRNFQLSRIDPVTGLHPYVDHTYRVDSIWSGLSLKVNNNSAFPILSVSGLQRNVSWTNPANPSSIFSQNSPPFLIEIDAASMFPIDIRRYEIPTIDDRFATNGGIWAPFQPDLQPWIHTPERLVRNNGDDFYALLAYRDEAGMDEYDPELLLTAPFGGLGGYCDSDTPIVYVDSLVPNITTTILDICDLIEDPNGPGQRRLCPFTFDCDCNISWPIIANGGAMQEIGRDVYVTKGYEYTTGEYNGVMALTGAAATGAGPRNCYVSKTDPCGRTLWIASSSSPVAGSYANGKGVYADDDGNTYVVGEYEGLVNFGSLTLPGSGSIDIFIAKINSCGEWVWARGYGGSDDDWANDVVISASGELVVVGTFGSVVNFGGGLTLTSFGGRDAFVCAFSTANGNASWVSQSGGPNNDVAEDIAVLASANSVYVTGAYQNTANFSGSTGAVVATHTSNGLNDVWVAEYSSAGVMAWASVFGGTGGDYGTGIDVDAGMGIYLTGTLGSTASTFAPACGIPNPWAPGLSGPTDMYVTNYTLGGCPSISRTRIGGTGVDFGSSVSLNPGLGRVHAVGAFNSNTVIDGATTLNNALVGGGTFDFMAWTLNSTTASFNGFSAGDIQDDFAWSIDYLSNFPSFDGAYYTGSFQGTTAFPLSRTSTAAGANMYLARVSSAGNSYKNGEEAIAEALPEASGLEAWPNPFRNELQFRLPSHEEIEKVRLMGLTGNEVRVETTLNGNEGHILLGDLSAGVYFLQVQTRSGAVFHRKVVGL